MNRGIKALSNNYWSRDEIVASAHYTVINDHFQQNGDSYARMQYHRPHLIEITHVPRGIYDASIRETPPFVAAISGRTGMWD